MAYISIKPNRVPHVDEAMVETVELTPVLFRKAVSPAVTKDAPALLVDPGQHVACLQHAGDEVSGVGRVGPGISVALEPCVRSS